MTPESIKRDIIEICPGHEAYIEVKPLADGRTHSVKIYDLLAFRIVLGKRVSRIEMHAKLIQEPELIQQPYTVVNGFLHFNLDLSFDYAAFLRTIPSLVDEMWEYAASEWFGCCWLFVDCSNNRGCLHHGNPEYGGCYYRKNLDEGRIFYGENRTV